MTTSTEEVVDKAEAKRLASRKGSGSRLSPSGMH